jgi:HPr kinase/phosphorylase
VEVHLVDWDAKKNYERTGLDQSTVTLLDVTIPKIILPINPGKNMTVICETIAMNELLKLHGFNTAQEFNRRLKEYMKSKKKEMTDSRTEIFLKDFE